MAQSHPLDPLSSHEILQARDAVLREDALSSLKISSKDNVVFNAITLHEPPKGELLAFEKAAGPRPNREAFVVVIDKPSGHICEFVVCLSTQKILSSKYIPDVQPTLTPDDCFKAEEIVKSSPEVLEELKKRGLGDLDLNLLAADPWSVSFSGEEDHKGRRLCQLFMYTRAFEDDNHYAHPLDFVPIVDLNEERVFKIDNKFNPDNPPPAVPQKTLNYAAKFRKTMKDGFRESPKPLEVVQTEGPSWKIEGNHITWQKWNFRLGFNYREGIVLHNVQYQDGDKLRPILYRASLDEMAVPYGDPMPPYHRKVAFDVGDYGLGYCATSLSLGCDCLGQIHYFDGVLSNNKGEPVQIPKVICMHEEDNGVMWKHVEYRKNWSEVRRSRRLVVSFIATVVNYEYAFYWYFYQDGTLQLEIKPTGELSTNPVGPTENPQHGVLVLPGVNAQVHQHMFNARIDFMVDGVNNVVSEMNAEPLPEGPNNPYLNGFLMKEKVLHNELDAISVVNSATGRYWRVSNPSSVHPTTKAPVAWKVMAPPTPTILARPESWIARRARFATRNVWVTPYDPNERYAAGDYPNQSPGDKGLPLWTLANRPIHSRDIVFWLSFGVIHVPRPEDFPVMPVETTGFTLKPDGFFFENPAVDLPVQSSQKSISTSACCEQQRCH
jgi:primary-amine oxidase